MKLLLVSYLISRIAAYLTTIVPLKLCGGTSLIVSRTRQVLDNLIPLKASQIQQFYLYRTGLPFVGLVLTLADASQQLPTYFYDNDKDENFTEFSVSIIDLSLPIASLDIHFEENAVQVKFQHEKVRTILIQHCFKSLNMITSRQCF